MRELNIYEIPMVSGAGFVRESDIVINGIVFGVLGYTGALALNIDPFYPAVIVSITGLVATSLCVED